MGKTLDGRLVGDALETFLLSLGVDVGAGDVTYLAINKGHLFIGRRDGIREGWSGPESVNAMIVDVYELTEDARASQLTS